MFKGKRYFENKYGVFDSCGIIKLNKDNVMDLREYQLGILDNCPEIDEGKFVTVIEYCKEVSDEKKIYIWMKRSDSGDWVVIDNVAYNPKEVTFCP